MRTNLVLSANLRSISPKRRQFFGEARGARYDGFVVIDECVSGADFAARPQGAIAHEKAREQHQSRVVGFQNLRAGGSAAGARSDEAFRQPLRSRAA